MSEGTKALNSSVSTLKKNPGRIGRLVKAAKLLIVPPHRLTSGKAKEAMEAAIKKLKAKRGLNGVKGEGAGPFSDKALGIKKEAMEQKTKDRGLAAAAVGSGAALGAGLTHDNAKSRIAGRRGIKNTIAASKNPGGMDQRLAQGAKVSRRMAKPLRRLAVKGGVVGAAVGAGLGAAHLMKKKELVKEAARHIAKIPKQEFLGKGKIPAGAKDVSPKAVLKGKAGKVGKVVAGVAAGAALVGAAKKHMEKKAAKKAAKKNDKGHPAVNGAVIGGMLAHAHRSSTDSSTAIKGLKAQAEYIRSKGGRLGPTDVKMAVDSLKKPMARRALKAAGKGAAVGALAGAAYKAMGHKKKAAEKVEAGGKTYRKGTVATAATKMGIAGAIGGAISRKGAVLPGGLAGAAAGGAYALARRALRKSRGEESVKGSEFKEIKKLKRMKEIMG